MRIYLQVHVYALFSYANTGDGGGGEENLFKDMCLRKQMDSHSNTYTIFHS